MSFGIPVRNGLAVGLLASTFLSSLRIGGRPAMFLNFIGTDSLDSRVTFTRASTATFVGSNGLIQTAAINAPRFDYTPVTLTPKGLLIEQQRTNLVTYSEDLRNTTDAGATRPWIYDSVSIAINTTTSPDGATTADTVIEAATNSVHRIYQQISVTSGTAVTMSFYAKAKERTQVVGTGGAAAYGTLVKVLYDLSAVTATVQSGTATATITDVGNGWRRCTWTATPSTTTTGNHFIGLALSGNDTYLGNGTSGAYVWGAQIETGAFVTSYIPTVALTVIRSADVASMTGTNFSDWYNQNAGTMLCNFILEGQTAGGTVSDVWAVNNSGSTANATRLREGTVIAGADVTMFTGGALQVDSNSFATPVNTRLKSAFAWSTTSSNLTANGVSLADGGAITPPSVNQLVLTGGNKWLQQISFYNTRLPNATLQVLTA